MGGIFDARKLLRPSFSESGGRLQMPGVSIGSHSKPGLPAW